MKIEHQTLGTVDVLSPIGALVDEDAEQFRKMLLDVLQKPNPRVVVSLQEVAYFDSVALSSLLDASDELSDRAMSLKLTDMPTTCREALELTGIASRFRFFETVEDAVKSFL